MIVVPTDPPPAEIGMTTLKLGAPHQPTPQPGPHQPRPQPGPHHHDDQVGPHQPQLGPHQPGPHQPPRQPELHPHQPRPPPCQWLPLCQPLFQPLFPPFHEPEGGRAPRIGPAPGMLLTPPETSGLVPGDTERDVPPEIRGLDAPPFTARPGL